MSDCRYISIKGVRTNSLNNIDVDIPYSKRAVILDYQARKSLRWPSMTYALKSSTVMEKVFSRLPSS